MNLQFLIENIHFNTVFSFKGATGESALDLLIYAEETEDTLAGVLEQESESKAHSDTASPPTDTAPKPEWLPRRKNNVKE